MLTPSLTRIDSGQGVSSPPPRGEKLEQAITRLFDRINYERIGPSKYELTDFNLSRMQSLLAALGDPQLATPCVHIAGTKGKGSTATMVASVLTAAGQRTGLFTSPHIHHFEERIRVDGTWIDPSAFAASFADVWKAVDQLDDQGLHATYFEITTAVAWDLFRRLQCDVAVVEVGLGGRLDSTNLCNPLVTAVTSISRDHSKLLGGTIESIAREKAGIFKEGVPVVNGVIGEAEVVVAEVAGERHCPLWGLGDEITCAVEPAEALHCRSMTVTTPERTYRDVPIGLPGEHQERNGALAVAICDLLPESLRPNADAVRRGMDRVRCALRVEVMQLRPTLVLDAAHNGASMDALLATVADVPAKKRWLVFGTSRDKHLGDMLDAIGDRSTADPFFDRVVVTACTTNPRAYPAGDIAVRAESALGQAIEVIDEPCDAIDSVLNHAGEDDLIVVTGSFFVSGEVRGHLLKHLESATSLAEQKAS